MGIDFMSERAVSRSQAAEKTYNLDAIVARMIQLGKVITVDEKRHAARVKFETTGIISGWLKILDARPYIPDYEDGESDKVRWEGDVLFGETEEASCMAEPSEEEPEPEEEPVSEEGSGDREDTGEEEPVPEPEPEPSGGCAPHTHEVKIRMWMPKIDDRVLCLYLPIRNGDGFIIGKIWP